MNKYHYLVALIFVTGCASSQKIDSENKPRLYCSQLLLNYAEKSQFEDVSREALKLVGSDTYCDLSLLKKQSENFFINLNDIIVLSGKIHKTLRECDSKIKKYENNNYTDSSNEVISDQSCEEGGECNIPEKTTNVEDNNDNQFKLNVLVKAHESCGVSSLLENDIKEFESIFEVKTIHKTLIYNDQINIVKKKIESDVDLKLENEKIAKKKSDDYNNSPESIYRSMCGFITLKKGYEKSIAREKQAAKISGVVDKSALYDYGKKILSMDDLINNISETFKVKFKKNLDQNKCVCINDNKAILGISCSVK